MRRCSWRWWIVYALLAAPVVLYLGILLAAYVGVIDVKLSLPDCYACD